jgi:hypothetical protein
MARQPRLAWQQRVARLRLAWQQCLAWFGVEWQQCLAWFGLEWLGQSRLEPWLEPQWLVGRQRLGSQ